MTSLKGTIAVVTGASRGAGKGIALALGEAGATVYVTGRSSRRGATTLDYPGTIEDTAEAVSERGGVGIPVQLDHGVEADVAAFFARLQSEHGRLDLLVNNAWGGHDHPHSASLAPFWELPTFLWDDMLTHGARSGLSPANMPLP